MFGLGAGRSAYPTVYSVNKSKKNPKKSSPSKQSKPKKEAVPSSTALGPAIDGPPSPERIRAYTEQMRRGSVFATGSRSNTISSTTPSYRSRESASGGDDTNSLMRKSSNRSNSGSMPSMKMERPESVQIFGSIFSRSGRQSRKKSNASSIPTTPEAPILEESSKEATTSGESARHHISTPYNFQHLTHTQPESLPAVEGKSQAELESQFSAIRASQVPSQGELKGIRAQDLHFENFSSDSLPSITDTDDVPPPISPKSPRRQGSLLRKIAAPAPLASTISHDSVRSPPPRPPRSPGGSSAPKIPLAPYASLFPLSPHSPPCPVEPPTRTSSRTASILFDTFDPLAATTLERPHTQGGFRRPAPFSPPVPPPAPAWSETDNYFSRPISHAMTTPGDESWPLSTSGTFGGELADVQEEDETLIRLSKISVASTELRGSMSVPALRLRSLDGEIPQRIADQSGMAFTAPLVSQKTILPPTFHGLRDSWEDDVDFCYENEIEANFDYQWDRDLAVEDESRSTGRTSPQLHLHLDKEMKSSYHDRLRPLLAVPSSSITPDLSPLSDHSASISEPQTPATLLRPLSDASSFKESHGFNLSPSLLIPTDFRSQMSQESSYDDISDNVPLSALFSVDESMYSNSSYRSSGFSRQSARSSSSTRISTINSRGSQDSGIMISRAASISKAHRSVSSDSSLPEMIPSALRNDMSSDSLASMNIPIPEQSPELVMSAEVAPHLSTHRKNKSVSIDAPNRKTVKASTIPNPGTVDLETKSLSPVVETLMEIPEVPKDKTEKATSHGRKMSVPLAGIDNAKFKVRARAATASAIGAKPRGSYALFPTIV